MQTLVIGFSRPKGGFKPFSWLIRLIENTPYSHVYIKFYAKKYDRYLVYQASGTQVNFISQERFNEEEVIVKEFILEVDEISMNKMIQFAIDNVGAPYGVKEIFGLGLVLLCRLFGKKIKNPFGDGTKSFFCSQLVDYILSGPLNRNITFDPDLVTPKDIYKYLEETDNGTK